MAFDLAEYLCPREGIVYLLSSNETCYSHLDADGWRTFSKNRHSEEFYVSESDVGRGADLSLISTDGVNPTGTFYVQYTQERYGCAWAKRWMDVGEVYTRYCWIKIYDYQCNLLDEYEEQSDLTLLDHFDSVTFPNGLIIPDVLLFKWAGEEGYLYANGFGLIGWKNLVSGNYANYVVAVNVAPPAPPFTHDCLPRPVIVDQG